MRNLPVSQPASSPPTRDWLAALISYGVPVALAVVGVVVLVVWSRVHSPEGVPAARTGQTTNPTPSSARSQAEVTTPTGGAATPGGGLGAPAPFPGAGGGPAGFPSGPPPPSGPEGGLGPPSGAALPSAAVATSGGGGPVTNLPGDWPRYRGASFDNINKEKQPLARSWPATGPRRLWQVKLGEGHAGAAVHKSRVYVLDYDQAARADVLRCFALADGTELWHVSYPVDVKRNHGMSRTVPAVTDKYVVTLGPKCHVLCADAVTGKVLWKLDMVQRWGATVPTWYAGQCPLIDGNRVLLAPGDRALMAAVDLASGKVLWETPNPKGWKMTHASIVPATIGGKKLYLYPASLGVVGVSPEGKLLWETTEWKVSTATIPCAIPVGDGRVFLCGGYNAGAVMLKLTWQGSSFATQVLYRLKATEFGSDQQTPILYQGTLYGVVPGGQMAALSLDGKVLWTSGATRRYGLGPYLLADGGLMYVLEDKTGTLTLAQVSPQQYQVLAGAKVVPGPDAWAPIALAGGRMLLRDVTTLVCLDVAGR